MKSVLPSSAWAIRPQCNTNTNTNTTGLSDLAGWCDTVSVGLVGVAQLSLGNQATV